MSRHEAILDNLEKRVKKMLKNGFVTRDVEYVVNGVKGQVDLLAYDNKHDSWTFYEVKSSKKPARTLKAYEQFYKFRGAFPDYDVNGVLINNKEVKRLR